MPLEISIRVGRYGFLKRRVELLIVDCDRTPEDDLDRIELGLAGTAEQSCLERKRLTRDGEAPEVPIRLTCSLVE
jgi:hypothetical protein